MPIAVSSGSLAGYIDQETSGSCTTTLFSNHGPSIGARQLATNQLKDDVTDAGSFTQAGIGKVWELSDATNELPDGLLFRTELPAHCNKDWSVRLEAHYGHGSNQAQGNKFMALSFAGRIISGLTASSGNAPNTSGSWTSTNVNFSAGNGGLKQPGWYPFGKVADNSGHFALPVPADPSQFISEKSRFVKLRDLVNEAEVDDNTRFRQGNILDICLARDLDPTRQHNSDSGTPLGGTSVRVHSVKVMYNQYTGSG